MDLVLRSSLSIDLLMTVLPAGILTTLMGSSHCPSNIEVVQSLLSSSSLPTRLMAEIASGAITAITRSSMPTIPVLEPQDMTHATEIVSCYRSIVEMFMGLIYGIVRADVLLVAVRRISLSSSMCFS